MQRLILCLGELFSITNQLIYWFGRILLRMVYCISLEIQSYGGDSLSSRERSTLALLITISRTLALLTIIVLLCCCAAVLLCCALSVSWQCCCAAVLLCFISLMAVFLRFLLFTCNCISEILSYLGPLMLLIYITDLPSSLKNGRMTMYADDTSISYSFRA